MLIDDEALRKIEDALVSATLQPGAWSTAVAQIVDRSGARGAAILPLRGRAPGVPVSASCEALIDAYFREGWAEKDHRMSGISIGMKNGLLVDQDISTPDFMRKSPYYTDFLGRFGFQWFAGLLVDTGSDAWGLSLQRTHAQGPFTPDEQTALRRLLPPLSRTARLAQTMGEARLHGIADTLEALRMPGMLLDRTGRVIHINERAEHLLGKDLDLTQGRLSVPSNRRASAAIRAHIEAAVWTGIRPDDRALNSVTIERVGRRPLILSAQPLRKAGLEFLDGARTILTIKDLDETVPLASDTLKALYNLTARELDLCGELLLGRSVAESADVLRINVSTARTHLKHILTKTDTNRQGELLMLLSRYAPK